MYKITLLLFFFIATFGTSVMAQTFEGTVQMQQETANGIIYDVTWYIKKDKIAFEISSASARGTSVIRFVPQKKSASILMITGDTKKEIALSEISTDYNFGNIQTQEVAGEKNDYTLYSNKNTHYKISTTDVIAQMEVSSEIDVDFSEYAAFFKNDCGMYILANSQKKGFPINSIATDKEGNLISKTTFRSMQKMTIDDSKFN